MPLHITFTNTPPLRDWMSEGEKEFRSKAAEQLTTIMSESTFFTESPVEISFFQEGTASVVALIKQDGKQYVFKTCFKPERALMEAQSFLHWNKAGVRTPNILLQGTNNGYAYFIMEYIDVPVVKNILEKDPSKYSQFYSEMGHIFYKLHSQEITGFGQLEFRNGLLAGKYSSLRDTLHVEVTPAIQEALDIVTTSGQKSVIGHFDFSTNHFFATEPLTIFDPDPEATYPSIDLAFFFLLPRSIEDERLIEMRKTVVQAYMEDSEPIDPNVLAASIVIKAHEKAYALRLLPSADRERRAKHMIDTVGTVADALIYLQKYL